MHPWERAVSGGALTYRCAICRTSRRVAAAPPTPHRARGRAAAGLGLHKLLHSKTERRAEKLYIVIEE